jgi:hypothetical protein
MHLLKKQPNFQERIVTYSQAILIFPIIELFFLILGSINHEWGVGFIPVGFVFLLITTAPVLLLATYILVKQFSKKNKIYCLVGLTITLILWAILLLNLFRFGELNFGCLFCHS